MKIFRSRLLLAVPLALAASVGSLGVGPAVHAAGAGAVTYTQTFHDQSDYFSDVVPCGSATETTYTVYETYNGVIHETELTSGVGAGTDWFTGTFTGTFTAAPADVTDPTYTGRFTVWFNENDNLHNGNMTSTLTIHGTGTDGSTIKFSEVMHIATSATGMTVSFDKGVCH